MAQAAPVAFPDSFSTAEDTPLQAPAGALLNNDDAGGAPGLSAAKVSNPLHGTVVVNTDGSFLYTPNANYAGQDSFTYQATENLGALNFTVDTANSPLNVTISSQTYITGGTTDNQTRTARVSGSIMALVPPGSAPFSQAQVQTLNLTLAESLSATLCVQRIIFCTASLTANIAAGGLNVTMTQAQAGPIANVTNGIFSQLGNKVNTTGEVALSGSGLAGLITLPPTAQLNSTDQPVDFTNASITQSGSTLTLAVPLDVTQQFSESGDLANPGAYKATVRLVGTVRATAPAPTLESSSPVTVTLNVTPVDDVPVAVADRYYARQSTRLILPATAAQTVETLLPALSSWKYSTGADLGTAWRNPGYDDAAWASVNGIKGYGDTDILAGGTITARANMGAAASTSNPNYPTCYFRKEVILTNSLDTVQPRVTLQRDDAALVYVNGTEIYRDSTRWSTTDTNPPLPTSGEVAYATYAATAIPAARETEYQTITFSRSLLREGVNLIAVAVKQSNATSTDLRFDLTFERTRGVQGLLANDTDVENDPLSAHLLIPSANGGSALIGMNGSVIYQPPVGFTGTDSFTYRLQQGTTTTLSTTSLIGFGGTWTYREPTDDLTGTAWQQPGFAATGWLTGRAPLGYGTGGNYPEIANRGTTLTFGADPQNKPLTHYFRKTFTLAAPAAVANLRALVRVDDGCALWLNGQEVQRLNLPGSLGDGTLTHNSAALSAINALDGTWLTFPLNVVNLVAGENTLAVEVHQAAPTSSDLVLDLRLEADIVPHARVDILVQGDDADNDDMSDIWEVANGFNTTLNDANADADSDGQTNRQEFLAGTDPLLPSSRLRVLSLLPLSAQHMELRLPTVAGKSYQLETSGNLSTWSPSGMPITPSTAPDTPWLVPIVPGQPFYRVRIAQDWR
jgi:hypothetical protein